MLLKRFAVSSLLILGMTFRVGIEKLCFISRPSNNVMFMGFIEHDSMKDFYSIADIVVVRRSLIRMDIQRDYLLL